MALKLSPIFFSWKVFPNDLVFSDEYMGLKAHFAYPLGIYLIWQIGYLFVTGKSR